MRVPHFLGDDDIRGQPHDGLSDDFLPRFVGADLPRAGGDLRGALEKENPAALYAGGIGGAIKQQNRPMVIRSVFFAFFRLIARKTPQGACRPRSALGNAFLCF